jgi:hypothetical protein
LFEIADARHVMQAAARRAFVSLNGVTAGCFHARHGDMVQRQVDVTSFLTFKGRGGLLPGFLLRPPVSQTDRRLGKADADTRDAFTGDC